MGVESSKLVLGTPWYGYRYPCQGNLSIMTLDKRLLYSMLEMVDGVCFIEEVPFRGCNCTDAAGREFAYKDVIKMLGEDDIPVKL